MFFGQGTCVYDSLRWMFFGKHGQDSNSGMLLQTAVFWKFYDFVEGQGFILEIHVLVINALLYSHLTVFLIKEM